MCLLSIFKENNKADYCLALQLQLVMLKQQYNGFNILMLRPKTEKLSDMHSIRIEILTVYGVKPGSMVFLFSDFF